MAAINSDADAGSFVESRFRCPICLPVESLVLDLASLVGKNRKRAKKIPV